MAGLPLSKVTATVVGKLFQPKGQEFPGLEMCVEEKKIELQKSGKPVDYFKLWENWERFLFILEYLKHEKMDLLKKLTKPAVLMIPRTGKWGGTGAEQLESVLSYAVDPVGFAPQDFAMWHEIGHTGGLKHSPKYDDFSGSQDYIRDKNWPSNDIYKNGNIGVFGWDFRNYNSSGKGIVPYNTIDLMGSVTNSWISDYNYAMFFKNRKNGLTDTLPNREYSRNDAKHPFDYFDDKTIAFYGFKNEDGNVQFSLSCFDEVSTSSMNQDDNAIVEFSTPLGNIVSYPCNLSESKNSIGEIKYLFMGRIPYRQQITSYRVYRESDPSQTIIAGEVPVYPNSVKAEFKWSSSNRLDWNIIGAAWGYDLFYSMDDGETWVWFGNGGDGVRSHSFGEDVSGKDLKILMVANNGKYPEVMLFDTNTGDTSKVLDFWLK